jgi:hypothetical protein
MKHTLLLSVLLFLFFGCKEPDGKISGVVSYYFNENFGNRPDGGAAIYILDSASASSLDLKSIAGLKKAFANFMETKMKYEADSLVDALIDHHKEGSVKVHAYTSPDSSLATFNEMGSRALQALKKYRLAATKVLADGNGNYTKTLPPGKYCILIESGNARNMPMHGLSGQIYFRFVQVKPGREEKLSNSFMLDDYLGV